MKKIINYLIFTLTCISGLQAQQLDNALLWQISGNGLEKPSYLYGTIHITCDASLNDNIKKALNETSQLALELDMDDPNMQTKMFSGIYMKGGKTIKEMVSNKEYDLLNTFTQNNIGAPINSFNNMKPFFIIAATYPKMIECSNIESFEDALMKIAKLQDEEIVGLETVEDQLNIFDVIPYEDQIKDLLRSAKDNLTRDKKLLKESLELYNEQDINGLIDLMNNDTEASTTKFRDIFLDNRNKKWISKMKVLAQEKPTFFGVGAAHLPGENGVIQLLRKEGYSVKPIK